MGAPEAMEVPKELQAEWKLRGWDWALLHLDPDLNEIIPSYGGRCPFLRKNPVVKALSLSTEFQ